MAKRGSSKPEIWVSAGWTIMKTIFMTAQDEQNVPWHASPKGGPWQKKIELGAWDWSPGWVPNTSRVRTGENNIHQAKTREENNKRKSYTQPKSPRRVKQQKFGKNFLRTFSAHVSKMDEKLELIVSWEISLRWDHFKVKTLGSFSVESKVRRLYAFSK